MCKEWYHYLSESRGELAAGEAGSSQRCQGNAILKVVQIQVLLYEVRELHPASPHLLPTSFNPKTLNPSVNWNTPTPISSATLEGFAYLQVLGT